MFSIVKKNALQNFFNKSDPPISETKLENSELNVDDKYDKSNVEIMEPYYFLHRSNNPLSQTFGLFNDTDSNKTYDIFLCMYRVNVDCKRPFIEYLVDIEGIPKFPSVPNFSCPSIVGDESVEHNTYFMNKCLTKLLEILKLNEIFGIDLLDKMYKGFVEQDDSNIFVVFECLPETEFHPKENVQWVILDEILFKQSINEVEIDPLLGSFFNKQEYMTELFIDNTYEDKHPLPFLMYLCTKDNNDIDYHNLPREQSIIDLTVMGNQWLGDCYYFSSEMLSMDVKLQRYAVFTDKAIYILRDISEITEIQIEKFIENNLKTEMLTTYFIDHGLSLWCVKNNNTFTRI
jgi:hypothetical protein